MSRIGEQFVERLIEHRRGIMGTVIFHLLLAILLLSVEISKMNIHTEMEVELDAPSQEAVEQRKQEVERRENIRRKTSEEEVQQMLRSIAVNENAVKSKDSKTPDVQKYIDEVMKDLEGSTGSRYKPRKDANYKQDSLQHARDRKQQDLDSLKSTFYSGASSVSYNLKDRYARYLPIPIFKCEFGGQVVVTITVNRRGVVQKAEVVSDRSERDDCLQEVAVDAALRSRFNERPDAAALQTGTITYQFVKQ